MDIWDETVLTGFDKSLLHSSISPLAEGWGGRTEISTAHLERAAMG